MQPEYILSKDEVEGELDDMKKQSIILKVHEPTDWVKSIVYACKSTGKLVMPRCKRSVKGHQVPSS